MAEVELNMDLLLFHVYNPHYLFLVLLSKLLGLTYIFLAFVYLKVSLYPLVYFPNTYNSWSPARPKVGDQNSVMVSHEGVRYLNAGAIICCVSRYD